MSKNPKYIFLIGADGVGKTTMAKMLVDSLRKEGVKAIRCWSRYNNYLSKPLLAFARLIGLNYYETHKGYKLGYHDFHKSKLLSLLFVLLQAIDVNIATFWRIVRPAKRAELVISDRGPFDTLVDVMVDTSFYNLGRSPFMRLYLWLIKDKALHILLTRKYEKIKKYKEEVMFDKKYHIKVTLYQRYADYFGWPIIENNSGIEECLGLLLNLVKK
jgi:thymidylate kinase